MEHAYLLFAAGFLIGVITGFILVKLHTVYGTLKIDTSNPEKDTWRLCFDKCIDDIPKKKRIMLKVEANADISHE